MKQIILIIFLLTLTTVSALAQETKSSEKLTDRQWQDLLTAVGSEDWNSAYDLSLKYLKFLKDDDEAASIANLRYIYLYAAAGKVSEGNMSFEELEKSVKNFVGKKVVLPYHPITQKCQSAMNFVCASDGAKNKVFIIATNKTGTTIHSFEYVELKEDFDFAKHDGEDASIGGIVKSIVPNPNKSRAIVMRIYISEGYIKLREQKKDVATAK